MLFFYCHSTVGDGSAVVPPLGTDCSGVSLGGGATDEVSPVPCETEGVLEELALLEEVA